jgi:hypothetical protein
VAAEVAQKRVGSRTDLELLERLVLELARTK